MTVPLEKVERDPNFRLTETDRQQLRRFFDLDALERLLSHVPPEHRPEIIQAFQLPTNNEVRELWYLGDPELQEMLEEVWAPFWQRMPLDAVKADDSERPGKRLAIARRKTHPFPHDVFRAVLAAIDRESWDDVSNWLINPPANDGDLRQSAQAFRAGAGAANLRDPIVLGAVPEGVEVVHIVYRLGLEAPARVFTVRHTRQGWRLTLPELLAQL
jgi:hypothetical protein